MPNQLVNLGVALVTSGPGATNAITGIADAMSDSVPLLVFTGQVATSGIGKDAFKRLTLSELPCRLQNTIIRFGITADIPRIIGGSGSYCNNWSSWSSCYRPPKDVVAKKRKQLSSTILKLIFQVTNRR